MMPNRDPRDGNFCPYLTAMKNTYTPTLSICGCQYSSCMVLASVVFILEKNVGFVKYNFETGMLKKVAIAFRILSLTDLQKMETFMVYKSNSRERHITNISAQNIQENLQKMPGWEVPSSLALCKLQKISFIIVFWFVFPKQAGLSDWDQGEISSVLVKNFLNFPNNLISLPDLVWCKAATFIRLTAKFHAFAINVYKIDLPFSMLPTLRFNNPLK